MNRYAERAKTASLKDKRQKWIRRFILVLIPLSLFLSPARAQTTEMEQRYNALAARFDGRDKQLQRDLKAYLQAYPYTTFVDEVNYMQGVLQVEKGHYKQGLKTLEMVEAKALSRDHQTDYSFYRGYAYLMLQDYERANIYFGYLAKSPNRHTVRADYYSAYCLYKMERYDDALPALLRLEQQPDYAATVPYYIAQIYFSQGRYDEAEQRAVQLLRTQPESANNAELHRLLGEIRYRQERYDEAAEQLTLYETISREQDPKAELAREDMYLLGHAEYRLGRYADAVRHLKMLKQQNDTLSESACLTIGHAYVQLRQPDQAKIWYQAAANYRLTPAITEEAAYNYTLCAYRASTALGESVRAFNDFLHAFPNSKYERNIYQLLSDALMQSKNYAAAISTLDSIANPTPKMLETKQYLRYQLAADAFLQGKMQQSVDWTSQVLNHRTESDRYTTEALYIRAEAEYRLHAYEACANDLHSFFAHPDAKHSANYNIARYTEGYTCFSLNQYDKARAAFTTYVDAAATNEPTYADALNRIGDCYFNARDFKQAISYYNQVSSLNAAGTDYALFQRGYALGLLRKYSEKISVLRTLTSRYPKSDYADDGVYETARAQLQLEDERGAIVTYEQLLATYPHSSLARKASLERAMLYRNLNQNNEAIAAYRQTIEKYPATDEAYTALDALQAIYVEQGRVDEYLNYTKSLAKLNMTVTTREDSLLFASAEMQYMQAAYAKAAEALGTYIRQYCDGGRYCTTARYYLADSYYRLGKTSEALEHYRLLAELAANPYQEEAIMRTAEISYDRGDYTTALEAFYQMNALASTRDNANTARLGILRCSMLLERYHAAVDIANLILGDQPVIDAMRSEALYARAKAYLAQNMTEMAQADLSTLAAEVRTAQGAEAKYLLAQSYFDQGLLDDAENEVMSFTQMNTSQQYWLARALVLLSDIYARRGETFQARQYLLALQQNYTAKNDDIATIVAQRLAALDRAEQPAEKEEVEDEE